MSENKYVEISEREIPEGVRFDVPARNSGQMIEVGYGTFGRGEASSGDPFKRVTDRGIGGGVRYYRLASNKGVR